MSWQVLVGRILWLRQEGVCQSADQKMNKMQDSRGVSRIKEDEDEDEDENAYREERRETWLIKLTGKEHGLRFAFVYGQAEIAKRARRAKRAKREAATYSLRS